MSKAKLSEVEEAAQLVYSMIHPTEQQRQALEAATAEMTLPHDPMLDLWILQLAPLDLHVDERNQKIGMYVHGLERFGAQLTRFAESPSGMDFGAHPLKLARPDLRVFAYEGIAYAMAMVGVFYRLKSARADFEQRSTLFSSTTHDAALWRAGDRLWVFWAKAVDLLETILTSSIDLSLDSMHWRVESTDCVSQPELAGERADQPLAPCQGSGANGWQCQIRDPVIFDLQNGPLDLRYALVGEAGITLARLSLKATEP
jgi:hypothetical protein